MSVPVQLEVLGPVRVLRAGQELALGPRLQRALIALLALHVDRIVSRTELVDALWGDTPPASANGSLATYLSGLRRVLEPDRSSRAPSQLLVSAGSGYRLRLPEQTIDVCQVQAREERARKALLAGDPETAVTQCREALALWRGQPLDDINCPFVSVERARLEELHLATVELMAEAMLAGERYDQVVAELKPVVQRHPLRERPRALIMTALHRAGNRAEALAHYEQARNEMVEKLGIDPGPHLRALRTEIAADGEAPEPAEPRIPTPAQLPHAVSSFTGRDREVEQLTNLLGERSSATAVIATIDGVGGVGKTALAVHVAHGIADRFPDGQLYLDLRGFDPEQAPLAPSTALGRLLRGLGVDTRTVAGDIEEQATLYRSHLSGKRMLILLDNAATSDQVRPLLPGSPGCSVLVTSRSRLEGLLARDGAYRVTLDVLSPEESDLMLAATLGDRWDDTQRAAAAELASLCGRLPLALRIAAAQLVDRRHIDMSDLCGELSDERARLDALDADDEGTAVRAVFSWSYHSLKPEAAHLFRLLGLHVSTEFSMPAAAASAGLPAHRVRQLLGVLAAGHLVEDVGRDRYRLHDLLKVYAADQALEHDDQQHREDAVRRMLDFYLHTSDAADRRLAPFRRRPQLPPAPDVQPLAFADAAQAVAWGELELANMVAATEQAARNGDVFRATRIPASMWAFLAIRSPWSEWLDSHQVGIDAAVAGGDDYGESSLLISLGYAYQELRRPQQALECLERSKRAFERIPDRPDEDVMFGALGAAYFGVGRIADAQENTSKALAGYRERGDRWGEGWALCNLGTYARELGRYEEATEHFARAQGLFDQMNDHVSQLKASRELGRTHLKFGRFGKAADCFRGAVDLYVRFGGRAGEGWSRHELAEALHRAGHVDEALAQWRQAVQILEEIDDPRAPQVRSTVEMALDRAEP